MDFENGGIGFHRGKSLSGFSRGMESAVLDKALKQAMDEK